MTVTHSFLFNKSEFMQFVLLLYQLYKLTISYIKIDRLETLLNASVAFLIKDLISILIKSSVPRQ